MIKGSIKFHNLCLLIELQGYLYLLHLLGHVRVLDDGLSVRHFVDLIQDLEKGRINKNIEFTRSPAP
jgi:hypothetical protein